MRDNKRGGGLSRKKAFPSPLAHSAHFVTERPETTANNRQQPPTTGHRLAINRRRPGGMSGSTDAGVESSCPQPLWHAPARDGR